MKHPNRARLSKLSLGLIVALAAAPAFAQSTSAGVGGQVTGAGGQPVTGAEVTIVHTESGTVSRATTDASGRYNARGLRVGGPYTITITKAGEGTKTEENVYLSLSQISTVNAALDNDMTTLGTVVATAIGGGSEVFSATKMGTGTNVNRDVIEALPSVGGNIQDYIRLDPRVAQVNKADGQISVGGQNPRYNAIRVDGVSVSDTFGLEDNNLPTRRQPVAMDALEAINVDISNYDVTIAGATGAVIDAVTKSGTNEFSGSVYGAYRDGDWFGKDPEGFEFDGFEKEQTYGVTFGGPILKDRLFFFANYEKQEWKAPGSSLADSAVGTGAISQAQVDEAVRIARDVHGFDAGGLGDTDGSTTMEERAVKIDWNITDNHRASFRYSEVDQSQLRTPSTSGTIVNLSSTHYQQEKSIKNYVAQMFSDWSENFSTEFKVSYRDYASERVSPNTLANIKIYFEGDEANPTGRFIQMGQDVSTPLNLLTTETWTGYGAGVLSFADHELKFGVDYSTNDVYNMFVQNAYGTYEFYESGLLEEGNFARGRWSTYQLHAPQPGASIDSVGAAFKYKELGLFVQDTWFVNNNLTLTFGLRADKPSVGGRPGFNQAALDAFGYDNSYALGKDEWLVQPRFGFNYTFDSERPTQLRGGIGLFRGTSPQVWFGNAYSNTGLNYVRYDLELGDDVDWRTLPFEPNGLDQTRPTGAGAGGEMNVNFVGPDFEQPSVWKANLAIDHELPWYGLVASAELLATQVKSALFYRSINIGESVFKGPDGRDMYYDPARIGRSWTSGSNRYRRNTDFGQVFFLDNTDKGESQQFTLSLEKPWSPDGHWSWNVGYTFTNSNSVSDMTSSTAGSTWNYNYIFNANEDVASTSRYEIRDRFSASLNWRHNFFGDYKTSVGVFYEGRTGRPFSYVFTNDANGDGRSGNDLFYVPNAPGDVLFGSLSSSGVFTPDPAMENRFFEWLEQNQDLQRYRGGHVDKNGGRASWVNSFDIRVSQELPGFFNGHKSEIWLDIMNVGNLINSDWGHIYDYGFFANRRVLTAAGIYDGKYVYSNFDPSRVEPPTIANNSNSIGNTGVSQWSLQLGFRYKF
jgi:outer membrane receptor protein involved in Fe transport